MGYFRFCAFCIFSRLSIRFPQKIIRTFQDDYIGLDVSNKSKAIISKQTVEKRKQDDINRKNYHNAVVGAM